MFVYLVYPKNEINDRGSMATNPGCNWKTTMTVCPSALGPSCLAPSSPGRGPFRPPEARQETESRRLRTGLLQLIHKSLIGWCRPGDRGDVSAIRKPSAGVGEWVPQKTGELSLQHPWEGQKNIASMKQSRHIWMVNACKCIALST